LGTLKEAIVAFLIAVIFEMDASGERWADDDSKDLLGASSTAELSDLVDETDLANIVGYWWVDVALYSF
jgi:hypothetical protein